MTVSTYTSWLIILIFFIGTLSLIIHDASRYSYLHTGYYMNMMARNRIRLGCKILAKRI